MSTNISIPTAKRLTLPAVLFFEGFEEPVVSGYLEGGTSPANWVQADQGFGASRHGLDNEDGADWDSPDPVNDAQGYNLRYTNSGLTSAEGAIGALNVNKVKYTIRFKIVMDKNIETPTYTSGDTAAYNVELCALKGGDARNDARDGGLPGDRTLASLSGTAPTDGNIHEYSLSYTTDPTTDASRDGDDLTIRLRGATSSGIITEVKFEMEGA